jgi:Fe-S cluster assembly protein SufD
MDTLEYFKKHFDRLQLIDKDSGLGIVRQGAFNAFSKVGIPTVKNEEWKYTRMSGLFNKEYQFSVDHAETSLLATDIDPLRLPGHEQANELVFVNGLFSYRLSTIRSEELVVIPLEDATRNEYQEIVSKHFDDSSNYLKDGIHALNTAFVYGGVFIHVKKGQVTEHPIYIYNITDTRIESIISQPRCLVHISEQAQVQIVETYSTIGARESFTNQVMEIIVEKEARVAYYKIQNDAGFTSQVSTTHIRQIGKSYVHAVTISLNGSIVRNNLEVILEAEFCEAHLYGLYFQKGQSHIDNHTLVDNRKPNCLSNELYKGIMDDESSGVFNGKIFVRPQAQKTNAYQSNKNILLSNTASVNSKPQLEIFADDVKCSHGCTVGKMDEEGLFYLESRGIPEKIAKSLLLFSFAVDILEHIELKAIRKYVDQLISERLEFDIS